ncbi:MAG: sulfotransferase [Planctomycetota bacterium]
MSQAVLWGRQIRETQIEQPPIFIIGHWRSGTTLLHELLVTNPAFASPSTYQCFAPSHFLMSQPWMTRFGKFLLPKQRPMDNMAAGWRLPQEDEFALMNLGLKSPYLRIAFPKSERDVLKWLDLRSVPESECRLWMQGFLEFLRVLTFHNSGKRLVLKSPTHTGRLGVLAEMFPDAKFIHLTREPTTMFSSTLRLWDSLEQVQALGVSDSTEQLERYVAECNQVMYQGFVRDRSSLDNAQIVDVRYQELAENPRGVVERLYEELQLGDFQDCEAALDARLENHRDYKPNRHQISEELERKVAEYWPQYCEYFSSMAV